MDLRCKSIINLNVNKNDFIITFGNSNKNVKLKTIKIVIINKKLAKELINQLQKVLKYE